ncbi:MAG: secretion protein HlyD, partial [Acidobacteria bacterium]|nr:secretion protein HlyD [Acidobacteriota bacterium]
DQALAVPIQALTIRKPPQPEPAPAPEPGGIEAAQTEEQEDAEPAEETEGVFVVRENIARFLPIKIGISGEKDFEVLEGLQEDDVVITGPYQAIRELQDGDPVKVKQKDEKDKS